MCRSSWAFLRELTRTASGSDWRALRRAAGRGACGVAHLRLPAQALLALAGGGHAAIPGSLGLASVDHPLIGAAVPMAGEDDSWLFTTRVALSTHPWIGDHVLFGSVVFPGIAFAELVLAAAGKLACGTLEQFNLEVPLFVNEGAVQLQLVVKQPDAQGRREFVIYSNTERHWGEGDGEAAPAEWVRHASGAVAPSAEPPHRPLREWPAGESWPPGGAEALDVDDLTTRLAGAGYNYGPAFMGIRAAWRRGEELFAESPSTRSTQRKQRPLACIRPSQTRRCRQGCWQRWTTWKRVAWRFPSPLERVRLYVQHQARCACTCVRGGDTRTPSLVGIPSLGAPATSIDSLKTRSIEREQLKLSRGADHDAVFEVSWTQLSGSSPNGSQLAAAMLAVDQPRRLPGLELSAYRT